MVTDQVPGPQYRVRVWYSTTVSVSGQWTDTPTSLGSRHVLRVYGTWTGALDKLE